MARPIVLSNGELHVGLNKWGLVHDFYFPYVGLENHAAGEATRHYVGIWVDGELSWLNSGEWDITFRYPHTALIGHTLAKNKRLGIALEFDDFVDSSMSAFLRNIHIINLKSHDREVRLFMHQAFAIGDSRSNTDTVQYLPGSNAMLHYGGRRAFIIGGKYSDGSFDQYTAGLFGIEGREGTFRDAEDGELSMSSAEHGRVDSTIRFTTLVSAHGSSRIHYWVAVGTSTREALYIHKQLETDGLSKRLHSTADWWHTWLKPALDIIPRVAAPHREMFLRSLMIIKSHIDNRGAIIASTDSSLLHHARDTYAYCWPRDGAFILWPLIRLGYVDEPRRFFEFCKRSLQPEGYLMHKYRADGALGSSWHSYLHDDGTVGPPIQEDETALVLFMFAQLYQKTQDQRLLRDFYKSMIVPMADFLHEYVDPHTGLPKPSYDLWEEQYATTTFTTSITYGALIAASELAAISEDQDNAVKWRSGAEDIQAAAHKHLFDTKSGSFYKGVSQRDGKVTEKDTTVDSSSYFGAFMFGLYASDSEELDRAARRTKEMLGFTYENPGMPRYEHDTYRQLPGTPSNWWPITSLWLAQYELEHGNIEITQRILDWTKDQMLSTGVLPEQVNPHTQEGVSVAPLAWSHAEYLATLLDTITEST